MPDGKGVQPPGNLIPTPMKTQTQIIEEIAKNKIVETIIDNVSKGTFPDTDDLSQDIYVELLSKPEEKIQQLYENNQLNYFIATMVKNNLFSVNSRYYYNYQKWNNNRTTFNNIENESE